MWKCRRGKPLNSHWTEEGKKDWIQAVTASEAKDPVFPGRDMLHQDEHLCPFPMPECCVSPVPGMQSGTRAWAVPLYVNIPLLESDGNLPVGCPLWRNLPMGRYSSFRRVFWFCLLWNVGNSCWFSKDTLLCKLLHVPIWAHPMALATMSGQKWLVFRKSSVPEAKSVCRNVFSWATFRSEIRINTEESGRLQRLLLIQWQGAAGWVEVPFHTPTTTHQCRLCALGVGVAARATTDLPGRVTVTCHAEFHELLGLC